MRFRWCEPYWEVEGLRGWSVLPVGTRPSHVVAKHSDAFTRPALPLRRVETNAQCDTMLEYEAAMMHRIAAATAQQFGRSVEQLKGRGRLPAHIRMRTVFAVAAADLGVGRDLVAEFMRRGRSMVATYAREGRTDMVSDRALRAACDAVVDGEFEAEACVVAGPCQCEGLGVDRIDAEGATS